jgi:NDP-sugar pyrophosphorylase family protein
MIEGLVGNERFGLAVRYSYDREGFVGTLGALRGAVDLLPSRFLVLYGDTYLPVDFGAIQARWLETTRPAMMTVLRNGGRWGCSNVFYERGAVTAHDKRTPSPAMRYIDYGLGGLSSSLLGSYALLSDDLSDLYSELAAQGLLCGVPVKRRFHEIGTPSALLETEQYLLRIARNDGKPVTA